MEQEAGGVAQLRCELSTAEPGAPVRWLKEGEELHRSPKFEMRRQGAVCELLIHGLEAKDTGEYACVVAGQKTLASVRVGGEPSCHTCRPSISPASHQALLQRWLRGPWGYRLSLLISAPLPS